MLRRFTESKKIKKTILLSYLWFPLYLIFVFLGMLISGSVYAWDEMFANPMTIVVNSIGSIMLIFHMLCIYLSGVLLVVQLFYWKGKSWDEYLLSLFQFAYPYLLLLVLYSGNIAALKDFMLIPFSLIKEYQNFFGNNPTAVVWMLPRQVSR